MTSLPVPDSPWSRTVASVGATNVARLIASAHPAECPTTRSCESWLDTATSRDLIESTALMAYLPRHHYEAVRRNSPRALCVTLTARSGSAATRATPLVLRRRIAAGRTVTTTLDTGTRSQPRERRQSPRSEGPLPP